MIGQGQRISVLVALLALFETPVYPCTALEEPSPKKLVDKADAIVRVTAVEAVTTPQRRGEKVIDAPIEVVRFRIDETIKGNTGLSELMLWGWAVENDDFNDGKVPYKRVRSDGLEGSCAAHEFRLGQMYLLILQRRDWADGLDYTTEWYALAPTAEQLRSLDDPWLRWVRTRASRNSRPN